MRHSLFYFVTLGFISGIGLCGMLQHITLLFHVLISTTILIGIFCFIETGIYSQRILKQYSIPFLIFITLVFVVIGAFRFQYSFDQSGDAFLQKQTNKFIEAKGRVVDDPSKTETSSKIIIELSELLFASSSRAIQPTKITVSDYLYSKIKYGDEVMILGMLEKPEPFETENGSVFQYDKYLAKDQIYYKMANPHIEVTGQSGNPLKAFLYTVKHLYIKNINAVIPFPQSGLAAGITVAGKGALPPDVLEDFNRSGTMQVVVLSGYNVSIVAETFITLCSFLPKFLSSLFGAGSIIMFTILAGGTATVVRGSVMAITVIIVRYFNRTYDVNRSVVLAAVLMLIHNPLILQFDPSFQFSFLATIGLLYGSPLAIRYLQWVPEIFGIREAAAATIASQFAVTPIILYTSGALSFMALFANIILGLVIPITMLFCFAAGIGSFLSVTLVFPFAWLAWLFLSFELAVVHIFSRIPFSFYVFPILPLWCVYLVYACYAVIIYRYSTHETSERRDVSVIKPV